MLYDKYEQWINSDGTPGGRVSVYAKILTLGEQRPFIGEECIVNGGSVVGARAALKGKTIVGPRTRVGTRGGNVVLTNTHVAGSKGFGIFTHSHIEGDVTVADSEIDQSVVLYAESEGKIT